MFRFANNFKILIVFFMFIFSSSKTFSDDIKEQHYKYTVIGASGDIGSALVKQLDKNNEIYQAVFRTQNSKKSYEKRSDNIILEKNYLILENLFDTKSIENIISNTESVYILMAALGLDNSKASNCKDVAINALLPIKIFKIAESISPDKRIIFGSSHVIYKLLSNIEVNDWIVKSLDFINENERVLLSVKNENNLSDFSKILLEQNPLPNDVSAYAISKLLVESYLSQSQLKNFLGVRISSSYGKGSLSGRSVQKMIEANLQNKLITSHQEARDYLDLEDLALILYKSSFFKDLPKNIFIDAASGEIVDPQYIWNTILKYSDNKSLNINFVGTPKIQVPQDTKWSKKLLGKDFISFDEGLKKQFEWMHDMTQSH
ncbi:MAG: hypothetical protein A2888_01295 [Chlamydiae bacterium RIFCSPLOWO2_01_FULL_28_7]|nr:MAG: hypothetical protein A2888_01295 [Chlamydiae bacterium RIFCSPLOWO2_01_FULL_28_7]